MKNKTKRLCDIQEFINNSCLPQDNPVLDYVAIVDVDTLKKAGIDWVKSFDKEIYSDRCNIDWIMHFFSITNEDLQ